MCIDHLIEIYSINKNYVNALVKLKEDILKHSFFVLGILIFQMLTGLVTLLLITSILWILVILTTAAECYFTRLVNVPTRGENIFDIVLPIKGVGTRGAKGAQAAPAFLERGPCPC